MMPRRQRQEEEAADGERAIDATWRSDGGFGVGSPPLLMMLTR